MPPLFPRIKIDGRNGQINEAVYLSDPDAADFWVLDAKEGYHLHVLRRLPRRQPCAFCGECKKQVVETCHRA